METPTFQTSFLGCRTNQAEIEEIQQELIKNGFRMAKPQEVPDFLIFNTCVVTKKAENEVGKFIRHFQRIYPKTFLIVMGCGVEAYTRKLINLPKTNLFLTSSRKGELIKILREKFLPASSRKYSFPSKFHQAGRVLTKIQEGCNHRCSYCIVPLLRGKSKSIPEEEIINQIKELKSDIKEIILVGTAISQWGQDLKPKKHILDLLKSLVRETSIPKITLSSLDPEVLDEKFAKFLAWENRLSPFLHLSLQSGSPKVLKDMGRKLDFNQLNNSIQLIKQRREEFILRADIIVGFPTETQENFQETLQLIKQLEIAFVHIFPFSPRPGTTAFEKIKKGVWQDLPKETKKNRLVILRKETEKIRKRLGRKFIGKEINLLTISKKGNLWQGIAENSFPVKIQSGDEKIEAGNLIRVRVREFKNNFLIASH